MQLFLSAFARKFDRHRFNPKDFDIVRISFSIQNLDSVFKDYRIVQISDIHMGHWVSPERLEGIVDLINRQRPDLIVITGDFVSYVIDEIASDMVMSLKKLCPRDAKVAVLGNHDHWMGSAKVRRLLHESNIIDLSNHVYTLRRGEAVLHVAGVDDVIEKQDRLDLVLEQLPKSGPAILLAHEPDFADISAATGRFSLQLSGHSHGGQIVLPFIGPIIRGSHSGKYPIGKYQVNGMIQYTNRGVGTHTFRLRINCPPEITVITLSTPFCP